MKEFFKVVKAVSGSNRLKLLKLLEKREEDLCRPVVDDPEVIF